MLVKPHKWYTSHNPGAQKDNMTHKSSFLYPERHGWKPFRVLGPPAEEAALAGISPMANRAPENSLVEKLFLFI